MNKKRAVIVALSILIVVLLSGFESSPQRKNRDYYEMRGEVMWEVHTDEKLIAFTFDDGPNANTTPLILDVLQQYDAKGTFFVIGNRIEHNENIIKRQITEGHEVANHGYSHKFFDRNYPISTINKEITETKNKIFELTGSISPWFRPPGGHINDQVVQAAKENGYTVILWSWHQDTKDWRSPGVRFIVKKVLDNARNGDIVLMHDNVYGSNQTVEALKIILPELKARGFKFVTVSELVRHKKSNEVNKLQLDLK
ncbi:MULTISPECIES: polysaccharide deacetylase family protein [unclassified Paenibacillus]|uniref:polysaccharide deacetylase family protein n=1 Tax=unclassified Paenibacillus TaxID=185978 RepID=UPI002F42C28E